MIIISDEKIRGIDRFYVFLALTRIKAIKCPDKHAEKENRKPEHFICRNPLLFPIATSTAQPQKLNRTENQPVKGGEPPHLSFFPTIEIDMT